MRGDLGGESARGKIGVEVVGAGHRAEVAEGNAGGGDEVEVGG